VFETWRTWDLHADRAKWGGEPAAALLTKYLKPGALTIYAEKVPARLMVQQRMVTARANDETGLVEIRKPFWGETLRGADHPETVPPALVYADLLATGERRAALRQLKPFTRAILLDFSQQRELDTIKQIIRNGLFPYPGNDGNRFGDLPEGQYLEYTVRTPGLVNRGARRIVVRKKTAQLSSSSPRATTKGLRLPAVTSHYARPQQGWQHRCWMRNGATVSTL
jgi:hypothetical protein